MDEHTMYPEYHNLSTDDLARLNEANIYEFLASLAVGGDAEIITTPHLTYFSDSHILSPMFNAVTWSDIPPDDVDTTIRETIQYFVTRKRPMAMWWVGPSTKPADLGERLLANGFMAFHHEAPAMAADLHTLPQTIHTPPGCTIDIVRTSSDAQIWADTFSTIYDVPSFAGQAWHDAAVRFGFDNAPFSLYLGRLDGRPVATGMLACSAGVAGLLGIGTMPDVRGRGIGTAITLQPCIDARARGYNTAVLFATEDGFPLYQKLGFREVGSISRYLWRM